MRNKRLLWQVIFVFVAIVAAAAGYRIGSHRTATTAAVTAPQAAAPAERQPLYWYDPMEPDQHFDKPGKSPFMDMQLLPKYADTASNAGSVSVNAQMAQNLGIRLARVTLDKIGSRIEVSGTLSADETRIVSVQARSAGWIEQLHVRAAQETVTRGQLLAEIYSPELLAAQDEFLLASRAGDVGLVEASRERLRLLGVSEPQIAHLERSGVSSRRVALYSPVHGIVQELGARQGMQLIPGTNLFSLVDLSHVWVIAELPEANAALAQPGGVAEVQSPALPGRTFTGKVDYVYPEVTMQTRTLKLRVVLNNPKLELKPGMFAQVRLSGAERLALLVPSEAVIRTGTRSVVILADAGQRYRPVDVSVGVEAGGRSEILSGLEEGQQVVASGQFLIDSEANLRASLGRIHGSKAGAAETTHAAEHTP